MKYLLNSENDDFLDTNIDFDEVIKLCNYARFYSMNLGYDNFR